MTEHSKIPTLPHEAILSSGGGFTAFSFGGYNIRFKAPYSLERYVDVVKWEFQSTARFKSFSYLYTA